MIALKFSQSKHIRQDVLFFFLPGQQILLFYNHNAFKSWNSKSDVMPRSLYTNVNLLFCGGNRVSADSILTFLFTFCHSYI